VGQPRLQVAFTGAFAVHLEERVRARLEMPCDLILADEVEIVSRLPEVDVLVTMAFTAEMGAASRRLKLVQVPGAGLDRIDRSALPTGTWLANAYGHEVGIAEYVIGAMLALTRLTHAAWALGFVSLAGIPGQIALGHLSDRIGREWVWTVGSLGFAVCYLALLGLRHEPTPMLLYVMVASQGMLGYGLTSVIGAIPAEIFQGPRYGTIFGTLMLAAIAGGAAGSWVTGVLYDATGSYTLAFWLAIACSALSAAAIRMAGPRQVRAVAGRIHPRVAADVDDRTA
jgi:MFS family permease